MRAFIIGNGENKNLSGVLKNDFIICADGGYNHAKSSGIIPDIVIGDMDSVGDYSDAKNVVTYPPEKDFTDSELAINLAIEKGCDEIVLTGMTGTRLDHTLANIGLLRAISQKGVKATLLDENNTIYYIDDKFELLGAVGMTVSVIPLSEKLSGVTETGFYYKLENEDLYFGTTRGVSNIVTEDKATITVSEGFGVVIVSRGQ